MSYCTTSSLSHLLNYPMTASSCAFFYDFSWKRSLWVTENSTRTVHKSDCNWGREVGRAQRLPAWLGKGGACLDSWGSCLFNAFLCVHGQFAVCSKTLSKLDEEAGIETRLEFPSRSGRVKFQSAYIIGEHVNGQDNIHEAELAN